MNDLKINKTDLVSVIQYAEIVGKTRGRIYQLIDEKDNRIKVVEIAGTLFINKTKSAKTLD